MSNSDEPVNQNSLREGNYLVHADAERLPDGGWTGFYRVDLHPEGLCLVETVIPRKVFGREKYKTADLALVHAISYGQHIVRSKFGKD